jgi:hypothetical protein
MILDFTFVANSQDEPGYCYKPWFNLMVLGILLYQRRLHAWQEELDGMANS